MGSFVVAAVETTLVIFNPRYIYDNAAASKFSAGALWTVYCISNYLPPIFHLVDLVINKDQLRRRQYFTFTTHSQTHASSSLPIQIVRVVWAFIFPVAIIIIWMELTDSIAHKIFIANISTVVITSLIAGILSVTFLTLFLTRVKSVPQYT